MRKGTLLTALGILFVSFNLRAPITAVGSLVKLIQTDFTLSNQVAGLITTIPLIAFAIVSPFVATFVKRHGYARITAIGVMLVLVGEVVRSYTGTIGLFIGTTTLGVGIAIGNVIVPSVIKSHFPKNIGLMTSIYTASLCGCAALGAGISYPLAAQVGLGWGHALAVWGIVAVLSLVMWIPQFKLESEFHAAAPKPKATARQSRSIWLEPVAWSVTFFMGIQSLVFYALVAWLPTMLAARGFEASFVSLLALLYQLVAIPATLIIPILCDKFKDQRLLTWGVCATYLMGMIGMIACTSELGILLSILVMALSMGGAISLSIAFISLRSPNALRTSQLSGMAQSAGYLLAAIGPVFIGYLVDVMGNWTIIMSILAACLVPLAISGIWAASHTTTRA